MKPITVAELAAPAVVLRIDLTEPDGNGRTTVDLEGFRSAWCLLVDHDVPKRIALWDVQHDSVAKLSAFTAADAPSGAEPAVPARPDGSLAVAICTRRNVTGLRVTLQSLADQTDTDFRVVVVDNAPQDSEVPRVVSDFPGLSITYVPAPVPGLSNARNRAIDVVREDYLAWLDDDESADATWVSALKSGFAHESCPSAVTGIMQPRELTTDAQVLFEQYGGFNKGRGLEAVVLRKGTTALRSPLYPLPNFGAGGNMAFRTDVLRDLGGFDPSLGAGTRTFGGEETKALAMVLRRGQAVLYWPAAITWHQHRRTIPELEQQMYGYAAGLSAFYMSMLRTDPSCVIDVLRLVPRGITDIIGNRRGGARTAELPSAFPERLLRANRRGLLSGARRYVAESVSARRAQARPSRNSASTESHRHSAS